MEKAYTYLQRSETTQKSQFSPTVWDQRIKLGPQQSHLSASK